MEPPPPKSGSFFEVERIGDCPEGPGGRGLQRPRRLREQQVHASGQDAPVRPREHGDDVPAQRRLPRRRRLHVRHVQVLLRQLLQRRSSLSPQWSGGGAKRMAAAVLMALPTWGCMYPAILTTP